MIASNVTPAQPREQLEGQAKRLAQLPETLEHPTKVSAECSCQKSGEQMLTLGTYLQHRSTSSTDCRADPNGISSIAAGEFIEQCVATVLQLVIGMQLFNFLFFVFFTLFYSRYELGTT
jgi:hypothetical protein